MIGPIVDSAGLFFGGVIGVVFADAFPERLKKTLQIPTALLVRQDKNTRQIYRVFSLLLLLKGFHLFVTDGAVGGGDGKQVEICQAVSEFEHVLQRQLLM